MAGVPSFSLLMTPGRTDLFAAMCSDVAAATAAQATGDDAVATWTGRFAKWRRMLQGSPEDSRPADSGVSSPSFSPVREHLMPRVGFDEAVRAWKGLTAPRATSSWAGTA